MFVQFKPARGVQNYSSQLWRTWPWPLFSISGWEKLVSVYCKWTGFTSVCQDTLSCGDYRMLIALTLCFRWCFPDGLVPQRLWWWSDWRTAWRDGSQMEKGANWTRAVASGPCRKPTRDSPIPSLVLRVTSVTQLVMIVVKTLGSVLLSLLILEFSFVFWKGYHGQFYSCFCPKYFFFLVWSNRGWQKGKLMLAQVL